MSKNANLTRAKREKNDEFYTQRADIEAELGREDYWKHFKGATVFFNCDDPRESEFWRHFHSNFSFLGLKKLISTHFEKEGRPWIVRVNLRGRKARDAERNRA